MAELINLSGTKCIHLLIFSDKREFSTKVIQNSEFHHGFI